MVGSLAAAAHAVQASEINSIFEQLETAALLNDQVEINDLTSKAQEFGAEGEEITAAIRKGKKQRLTMELAVA